MARIHGHYHKSSDCFEYPKKSLLNYKAAQKFPTQKNPGIENFTPGPPKSFDHPCHFKSGVHPPPPPGINGRHSFDFVCIVLGPAAVLIFGCNTFFPSKICCLFEGAAY